MPLPNHNSESNKSNTSVLNKTGTGKTPASNRAPGVYHIAHVAPSGNRMGNGASSTHIVIDGEQIDVVKLKHLVPELRKEIRNRDSKIQRYEGELVEKCKQLEEKDVEICKLRAEVDKLQSVLQIKVHKDAGKPDILATIQEDATMAGQETRTKKQGVSGESSNANQNSEILELKHHEKDFRYIVHIVYSCSFLLIYLHSKGIILLGTEILLFSISIVCVFQNYWFFF